MTKKNKKLTVIFVIGCICAIAVAIAAVSIAKGVENSDKILDGVTIGNLSVGGMTQEEAQKEVEDYTNKLENRNVTIAVGDESVTATAAELGFSSDPKDSVEKAYQLGKSGNFFKRMQTVSKLEAKDKKFDLESNVDEAVLRDYIEQNCTQFNVKTKNSKLKLVRGKFKATKSRDGLEVQVEDTVAVVSHALLKDNSGKDLDTDAVVQVKKAKYTKKQVAKCKNLLGSYSTDYSKSTAPRANNVRVAANYINGTIIYPGKVFSVVKTIKDRTEANGYQSAPEYSSGKVVAGVGGGVCQVSTTLYNAVINAELEIVERSPHSMVVGYVDVSRDAAIAGDYKDFKFKNNTDAPVYIAASADGSTLSFKIYGEETRAANREISFESEILEKIQPGEAKITEDPSLPASYRAVTQSAHVGYKAKLWKIVKVDGVQTDKIQINSSVYNAEPEHITVGKQAATPAPSENPKSTEEPKESQKPKTSKEPKATKAPKVTAAPKQTKSPKATKKPKSAKAE